MHILISCILSPDWCQKVIAFVVLLVLFSSNRLSTRKLTESWSHILLLQVLYMYMIACFFIFEMQNWTKEIYRCAVLLISDLCFLPSEQRQKGAFQGNTLSKVRHTNTLTYTQDEQNNNSDLFVFHLQQTFFCSVLLCLSSVTFYSLNLCMSLRSEGLSTKDAVGVCRCCFCQPPRQQYSHGRWVSLSAFNFIPKWVIKALDTDVKQGRGSDTFYSGATVRVSTSHRVYSAQVGTFKWGSTYQIVGISVENVSWHRE